MRWVVQENLGTSGDALKIAEACEDLGLNYDLIHRIPFSTDLPDIPTNELTIFYGSTRFVNLAFESRKWHPCAFFHPERFTTQCWLDKYGVSALNWDAKLTTLAQFCFEPRDPDRLFFVRPDKDLKEFQGGVWSFRDLKKWKTGLLKTDLGDEQLAHIPILVGEPWGIRKEWRCFMVAGKVVEASQYRVDHGLKVSSDVPESVIKFVEERAAHWSPHPIFVLDICQSGDNLYVLEVGCVNSAGFYACNIHHIVEEVSKAVYLLP